MTWDARPENPIERAAWQRWTATTAKEERHDLGCTQREPV